MLDRGLKKDGGVVDIAQSKYKEGSEIAGEGKRNWMLLRYALDFTFWAVVNVILLNMLFGIMIDSFAAIREDKTKQYDDM